MKLSQLFNRPKDPKIEMGKQLLAEAKKKPAKCDLAKALKLIEDGAALVLRDARGEHALAYAAQQGNAPLVEALLKKGVEADEQCQWANTPLIEAARYGHAGVARALLAAGANPDAINVHRDAALHWAAFKGHKDFVAVLLEHGARTDKASNSGMTPYQLAKQKRHAEICGLIEAAREKAGKAAEKPASAPPRGFQI